MIRQSNHHLLLGLQSRFLQPLSHSQQHSQRAGGCGVSKVLSGLVSCFQQWPARRFQETHKQDTEPRALPLLFNAQRYTAPRHGGSGGTCLQQNKPGGPAEASAPKLRNSLPQLVPLTMGHPFLKGVEFCAIEALRHSDLGLYLKNRFCKKQHFPPI